MNWETYSIAEQRAKEDDVTMRDKIRRRLAAWPRGRYCTKLWHVGSTCCWTWTLSWSLYSQIAHEASLYTLLPPSFISPMRSFPWDYDQIVQQDTHNGRQMRKPHEKLKDSGSAHWRVVGASASPCLMSGSTPGRMDTIPYYKKTLHLALFASRSSYKPIQPGSLCNRP